MVRLVLAEQRNLQNMEAQGAINANKTNGRRITQVDHRAAHQGTYTYRSPTLSGAHWAVVGASFLIEVSTHILNRINT